MRVLCLCSYVRHSVGMLALVTGLTACVPTLSAPPDRVWGTRMILEVAPILACSLFGVAMEFPMRQFGMKHDYKKDIYSTAQ